MGRPPKKKDESLDKLMQVRVREKEYVSFKEAAQASGLELSSWVRQQLLLAAKRDMKRYT
jgi:hypothetical protein